MTNKILQGLTDAVEGRITRATFYGIDWSSTKDRNAVACPRCHTGHQWRKRAPKACRNCGLKFRFSAAVLPSEDGKP